MSASPPPENAEVVRRAVEAFKRGRGRGVDGLSPSGGRLDPLPEWLEENLYRGHEGVRAQFAWMEEFTELQWEVHELRPLGDDVLVHATLVGRTSPRGRRFSNLFWRPPLGLRDGLVAETRYYRT